jgi:hypothetical protein
MHIHLEVYLKRFAQVEQLHAETLKIYFHIWKIFPLMYILIVCRINMTKTDTQFHMKVRIFFA